MELRGAYHSMPNLSSFAFRQQYQINALNKKKLELCVLFHSFLFFVMLARLSPCILKQINVSIIDTEKLEIPETHLWEWIWLSSFLTSVFCLDAIEKNKLTTLRCYLYGIVILGFLPLISAIFLWFSDVWVYLFSNDFNDKEELVYWKGYPYGLLWYIFILLALLIHSFSMYLGIKLMSAWKPRGTRRSD